MALSFRLEHRNGRWRLQEIEEGLDGLPFLGGGHARRQATRHVHFADRAVSTTTVLVDSVQNLLGQSPNVRSREMSGAGGKPTYGSGTGMSLLV
jgi:hypothetical protein